MRLSHAHPMDRESRELSREDIPTRLPLTCQQQWLLGMSRQYRKWNCTSGYTFRLKGPLSLALLRQSLEQVVRRHSSLRARIVSTNGITGQWIEDVHPFYLDTVLIHGTSQAEIEANATRAAEDLYDARMDLADGPLWVTKLLRLSDCEHWLVLVMHRLIAECSSIERVFQEVRSLYDELTGVRASTFPATPPQYSDYAVFQQETDVEWIRRHGPYWNDHLAGAASVGWPADPAVTVTTQGSLGKMSCAFGSELSVELRELSRTLRVLSPIVMLAIYAATIWRWTRQEDFVLPFNVAGRQSEHRPVIGYFSYILYLRVEVTGRETFRELLGRVSNEFYRALAHQDFGRIAEQRPELLAGTLFQWITWHPDDIARVSAQTSNSPPDIAVERIPIRDRGEGLTILPPGMVDVEITLFDAVEGLCSLGTYRADRFTAQTMERLMVDLRSATNSFVRNPDIRVA